MAVIAQRVQNARKAETRRIPHETGRLFVLAACLLLVADLVFLLDGFVRSTRRRPSCLSFWWRGSLAEKTSSAHLLPPLFLTPMNFFFKAGGVSLCLVAVALLPESASQAAGKPKIKPTDFAVDIPGAMELDQLAKARVAKLGPVDWLGVARRYADCMIEFGRDRYGTTRSPLFANAVTREPEPQLTPYPLFAPITAKMLQKEASKQAEIKRLFPASIPTSFNRFDFNRCVNYPEGLGSAGPHKVTVYGCDPEEDRDLYYLLFDLTRITHEARYRGEAELAIEWWFRHTQGEKTGLYPWGEHLGWDFVYERPTYFAGPSERLYHGAMHEVKDRTPFTSYLAKIPAAQPGGLTPLERYALGIWRQHFWDKPNAIFCRHGDYTGEDNRLGSPSGFPAHIAAYFRIWAAAYLQSTKAPVKQELREAFDRVTAMMVKRTTKYGFLPYDFEPELNGGAPQRTDQSDRLAHHCIEVAPLLEQALPETAARMREFARLQLGEPSYAQARADFRESGPSIEEDLFKNKGGQLALSSKSAEHEVLVVSADPAAYAKQIIAHLSVYRAKQNAAALKAAEDTARLAFVTFCDDASPLPRALPWWLPLQTPQGEKFPDFSYRGAPLMRAFAALGEMKKTIPSAKP